MNNTATTLLRLPEVRQRTGMSKTQIYRLSRSGEFPTGIRISPRCTCWSSADIDVWIQDRIAQARQKVA